MGSGFKTFTASSVLTASDVQGYLMSQAVMSFANSTARTTALGGGEVEGMVSYLQDTNTLEVYDGSAWVPVGMQWTTHTPTWNNLTVGNGTEEAAYMQVGKVMVMVGNVAFGSTTSVTGNVGITLVGSPDTSLISAYSALGVGVLSDGSTRYPLHMYYTASRADFQLSNAASTYASSTFLSASAPAATWWASGDDISYLLIYAVT